MHTCTCLWTGALADDLDMDARRARSSIGAAARCTTGASSPRAPLYAQPFSEGGTYDGTARMTPFSTVAQRVAGGWRINGRKIFASLAGAADYYGILCGEARSGEPPSRRDAMYLAVPADAAGRRGRRRLGSARHARHGLAHARCSRMSSSTTTPR